MTSLPESPYPLENITDKNLQKLAQALWNWEICDACQNDTACVTPCCSWRRAPRLTRFFGFYKDATLFYVPELLPGSTPALRNHDDIVEIIQLLRKTPNKKRAELTHEYFSRRGTKLPPIADQCRAFNLAVQVMSMMKCSTEHQPSGLLELGTKPIPWRSDHSLVEFMSKAFPQVDTGNPYACEDLNRIQHAASALTARKLKKAGLWFQGTDDLRNHLRMDTKKGIVEIYHYTSVLKEHLTGSLPKTHDLVVPFETSISAGNVPRQVALEALDSIQKVIFPFDSDSEQILRELVSNKSFDPDCLHYDSVAFRNQDEEEVTYHYFGARLMDLLDEVQDPSPRGMLEKWFERRSGSRYVMMATLIGVMIAVILGVLGLAVGIFQAWVGYEAWKHPTNAGG